MLGIPSEALASAKTVIDESPRRREKEVHPALTPPSVASGFTVPLVVDDGLQHQHQGVHPNCMNQFTTVQFLHLPLLPHLSMMEHLTDRGSFITVGIWLNCHLTKLKLTFKRLKKTDCLPVIRSIRHHSTSLASLELRLHGSELPLFEV